MYKEKKAQSSTVSKVAHSSYKESHCFTKSVRKEHTKVNPTCDQKFLDDPIKYAQKMNPTARAALNYLLAIKNKYAHVYVSQETIAKEIGVTRRTVNTHIRYLVRAGLIGKVSRWNTTCNYYFNIIFADESVRRKLAPLMPALKGFLLTLILSSFAVQCGETPYLRGYFKRVSHDKLLETIYIRKKPTHCKKTKPTSHLNNFKKHKLRDIGIPDVPAKLVRHANLLKIDKESSWPSNIKEETTIGESKKREIQKRERVSMNNKETPIVEIPKYINEIRSINLTQWGEIQLSAFPKKAIENSDKRIGSIKPKKPFSWFFSACRGYCKDRQIIPNWDILRKLKQVYNPPMDAQMVKNEMINAWTNDSMPISQATKNTNIRTEIVRQRKEMEESRVVADKCKNDYIFYKSPLFLQWIKTEGGKESVSLFEKDNRYRDTLHKKFLQSSLGQLFLSGSNQYVKLLMQPILDKKVDDSNMARLHVS